MRTSKDRLRHTLLFELLLTAICIPLLAILLHEPMSKMGLYSVMMSTLAMTWNYIYNLGFDRLLLRLDKPLYPRTVRLRLAHSLLFEMGFLFVSVPVIMWWLGFNMMQALALDVAFIVAVPIYALAFNWTYDIVFPPPSMRAAA